VCDLSIAIAGGVAVFVVMEMSKRVGRQK